MTIAQSLYKSCIALNVFGHHTATGLALVGKGRLFRTCGVGDASHGAGLEKLAGVPI